MVKIMGVVTTRASGFAGAVPIFLARDLEELQKLSHSLEKILNAAAHQLSEDSFLLVYRG